jgi:hypothetical protein
LQGKGNGKGIRKMAREAARRDDSHRTRSWEGERRRRVGWTGSGRFESDNVTEWMGIRGQGFEVEE